MVFEIELPHVGESVTEAVIGKWLKSPGDKVEKYDSIVEVITDKVNMDVPCPASGTLTRIIAVEGETVPMGSVIGEMETSDMLAESQSAVSPSPEESLPTASRIGTLVQGANVGPTGGEFLDTSLAASSSEETTPVVTASARGGDRTQKRYSPVVTRLAAQHNIDLDAVVGTGLGGRVTKNDVLAFAESGSPGQTSPKNGGDVAGEDTVIDPSPIRRMIADHMVKSTSEIPHAWSAVEVDMTGVVEWRGANRNLFETEHGVRLTYLPITLHVVAHALKANPKINSRWADGRIVLKGAVNVGVAVAAPDGLVVPVVHRADSVSVLDLARSLESTIERARSGSMTINDVAGGTFTLNNTGALGSIWGGAIINHPQAAILTTEAIVKRPMVVASGGADAVEIRSMMNICLSFDHRIIDGAEASGFLQAVKSGLEAITPDSELE